MGAGDERRGLKGSTAAVDENHDVVVLAHDDMKGVDDRVGSDDANEVVNDGMQIVGGVGGVAPIANRSGGHHHRCHRRRHNDVRKMGERG